MSVVIFRVFFFIIAGKCVTCIQATFVLCFRDLLKIDIICRKFDILDAGEFGRWVCIKMSWFFYSTDTFPCKMPMVTLRDESIHWGLLGRWFRFSGFPPQSLHCLPSTVALFSSPLALRRFSSIFVWPFAPFSIYIFAFSFEWKSWVIFEGIWSHLPPFFCVVISVN